MSYASFTLSCQNYELLMFWLNKIPLTFPIKAITKLDVSYKIPDSSFITVTPKKQHFFSTFFHFYFYPGEQ